ncbi:MAG: S-layer homology domain-containing protein [Candidatus Gracilibacteria bacterium]
MKKIQTSLLFLTLVLSGFPLAHGQSYSSVTSVSNKYLTRGEAVHEAVEALDLQKKNAVFIADCLAHLDECFFVFTAMTRFDGVTLDPLRLYPDVSPAYAYSEDIHLATMLGLVHGNIDVKGSPFSPRAYMSRIQALKVILGAASLMEWREKFELIRDLGNEDALRDQTSSFADVNGLREESWWYPRYVNFALDIGVVDAGEYFRPDEPVTRDEYEAMLQKALKKSSSYHVQRPQDQSRRNSSQQAVNGAGPGHGTYSVFCCSRQHQEYL